MERPTLFNIRLLSIIGLTYIMASCGGSSDKSTGSEENQEPPASPELTLADGLYKKYPLKFCTIEYKMEGASIGQETIYFENWGTTEAIYSTYAMEEDTSHQLAITTPKWGYQVDLDYKSGHQLVSNLLGNMKPHETVEDLLAQSESSMMARENKRVGTATIAGKECVIWENEETGARLWIWNTIPLKSIIKLDEDNSLTKEAVLVDDTSPIPVEKFTIPDDIVFDFE